MRKIKIATRGSELALWQSNYISKLLNDLGYETELLILKTQGDIILNVSLDKLEGKGFFTKELENALLLNEADIAVHSHKDLPTTNPPGLIIAAVSYRENAADVLLVRPEAYNPSNPSFPVKEKSVIGTSSNRRISQIKYAGKYVDAYEVKTLRGNVPTRINKLRNKEYDAILLAAAGVYRLELDLSDFYVIELNKNKFVPAPAQGALGIQCREEDTEIIAILQQLHHPEVENCIAIERKVLNILEGGCHMPLGVYCTKQDDNYHITALLDSNKPYNFTYPVSTADIAQKIVDKLQSKPETRILYTNFLLKYSTMYHALNVGKDTLDAKALIMLNPVEETSTEEFDWVFFTSSNTIQYFFMQHPPATLRPTTKYGTIGESTAAYLTTYNLQADFVGNAANMETVAQEFSTHVKSSEKVLFPQSNISLQRIQKVLQPSQVINKTVYETVDSTQENLKNEYDVAIFTSPSNVASFFRNYTITAKHYIAIGNTTAKSLQDNGITNVHIAPSPTNTDIITLLYSII